MSLVMTNTVAATPQAVVGNCFGPLAAVLSDGGYSGSLDCNAVKVDIRKVGTVTVAHDQYAIYDLRYQTVPVAGGVPHGGQRVLIVLNRTTYVGQYALDTPPFHDVSVKGMSIFINASPDDGNEIKIDKSGPPASVYLDQDTRDLSK